MHGLCALYGSFHFCLKVCLKTQICEHMQTFPGHALVAVIGTGGLGWWAIQFLKALYQDKVHVIGVDIKVNRHHKYPRQCNIRIQPYLSRRAIFGCLVKAAL